MIGWMSGCEFLLAKLQKPCDSAKEKHEKRAFSPQLLLREHLYELFFDIL